MTSFNTADERVIVFLSPKAGIIRLWRFNNEVTAVIAELNAFEQQYGLTTVEFFARFKAGLMGDNRDFLKWAGAFDDYRYLIDQYFNIKNEAA